MTEPRPIALLVIAAVALIAWPVATVFGYVVADQLGLREVDVAIGALAGLVPVLVILFLRRPLGRWRVRPREALIFVSAAVLYALAAGYIGALAGQPEAPELVLAGRRSTPWPIFALAVVVVAPLWEELLFRGLVFDALKRWPVVAVGVSAAVWTGIHFEYPVFDLAVLFGAGLLFGAARWRTGAVWIPIVMHAAFNTVAVVQLYALG